MVKYLVLSMADEDSRWKSEILTCPGGTAGARVASLRMTACPARRDFAEALSSSSLHLGGKENDRSCNCDVERADLAPHGQADEVIAFLADEPP